MAINALKLFLNSLAIGQQNPFQGLSRGLEMRQKHARAAADQRLKEMQLELGRGNLEARIEQQKRLRERDAARPGEIQGKQDFEQLKGFNNELNDPQAQQELMSRYAQMQGDKQTLLTHGAGSNPEVGPPIGATNMAMQYHSMPAFIGRQGDLAAMAMRNQAKLAGSKAGYSESARVNQRLEGRKKEKKLIDAGDINPSHQLPDQIEEGRRQTAIKQILAARTRAFQQAMSPTNGLDDDQLLVLKKDFANQLRRLGADENGNDIQQGPPQPVVSGTTAPAGDMLIQQAHEQAMRDLPEEAPDSEAVKERMRQLINGM